MSNLFTPYLHLVLIEANVQRNCICGKKIAGKRDLCDECYAIYGRKWADWPLWLRDWMCSTQHERYQERRANKREVPYSDKYVKEQ
jgi:hypothetical protein